MANVAIMATNQLIRSESAPIFYRATIFCFLCPSELSTQILKNRYFRENVTGITVSWHGAYVNKAFSLLTQCKSLESLAIGVWDKTITSARTERELLRMKHFPNSKPRLFDALGMDELLTLRGLKHIDVCDIYISGGSAAAKREIEGLQALLRSKVLLPRPA